MNAANVDVPGHIDLVKELTEDDEERNHAGEVVSTRSVKNLALHLLENTFPTMLSITISLILSYYSKGINRRTLRLTLN